MRYCLFALALATLVGCGEQGPVKIGSTVNVNGKVTLANGSPVKDVRIFFHTIESPAPASGAVGSDGSFTLQTVDEKKGILPGKYAVMFRELSGSAAEIKKSKEMLAKIPEKYKDESSPYHVEITSSTTSLDIKLEAK